MIDSRRTSNGKSTQRVQGRRLLQGIIYGAPDLAELFLDLGRRSSTGTLELRWGRTQATVLVRRGEIVAAMCGLRRGRTALDRILSARGANYAFAPGLDPDHDPQALRICPSVLARQLVGRTA